MTQSSQSDKQVAFDEQVTIQTLESETTTKLSLSTSTEEGSLIEGESREERAAMLKRRSRLPAKEATLEISHIWNVLKTNAGKDLSTIAMPVLLNEPINLLQKLCEELEYCHLLHEAAKDKDPVESILKVAAFAISSYASTENRVGRKPFNPLLGETYEYQSEDRKFRFISEKVQHRPPVMACFAESKRFTFQQENNVRTKFGLKSMELIPSGRIHVVLKGKNEHYSWEKVTSCMKNILSGNRFLEHYGTTTIICHTTGYTCKLSFKESGYFSNTINKVSGTVYDPSKKAVCTLSGRWNESIFRDDTTLLWKNLPQLPNHSDMFGFSKFAVELNELTDDLRKELPKTDTRFRPDQRMYEEGKVEEADVEKARLEQLQRESRTADNGESWKPRFFELRNALYESETTVGGGKQSWQYNGKYWDERNNQFKNTDLVELW